MRINLTFILIAIMMAATPCRAQRKSVDQVKVLIDSLYLVDQQVQQDIIQAKTDSLRRSLFQRQLATFNQHKPYLVAIIDQYGFPGYDLVGKETASHFFILVQHCDEDAAFQQRVLTLMKPQVDRNNADARGFAYLTDRVLVNAGELQLFGTQLSYEGSKAVISGVSCVGQLDERRARAGLEPIRSYLQRATQMHRAMNSKP